MKAGLRDAYLGPSENSATRAGVLAAEANRRRESDARHGYKPMRLDGSSATTAGDDGSPRPPALTAAERLVAKPGIGEALASLAYAAGGGGRARKWSR